MDDAKRVTLCEWVRVNGLDPNRIPEWAGLEEDLERRTLTTEVALVGADGRPLLGRQGGLVTRRATVPLVVTYDEFINDHAVRSG